MIFHKLSFPLSEVVLLLLVPFYLLGLVAYRLWFSPYAAFPGPKLAAITHGYNFYFDMIKGGQYIYKVEQLHKKYGPVLRISPNEIHVNNPDFYDILFSNGKRDKPSTWSGTFGNPESMFSTVPHNLHRLRRLALNPYFSATNLRKLEKPFNKCISQLISVLRKYQARQEPIPLKAAFAALTTDIITESCFSSTENYIEAPDFNAAVLAATEKGLDHLHFIIHFQWLVPLFKKLPDKLLVGMLGPGMATLLALQRNCEVKIRKVMEEREDYHISADHKTIFHDILDSNLPPDEKTPDRLSQEGQTIIAAGTVTTAVILASIFTFLLLDPPRLHILIQELEQAIPDISKPQTMAGLVKLPYLKATIQETLRLISGVSFRLARSAPDETLHCNGFTFPPNTNLCMYGPHLHHSPTLFPSPRVFNPERWLPGGTANPKYLISYSKGTRRCLGMDMANTELYITTAVLLRTFVRSEKGDDWSVRVSGMRLYQTDRRDVDMAADFGLPRCVKGRGNIRVVLE